MTTPGCLGNAADGGTASHLRLNRPGAERDLQWGTAFVRRVTRERLIATIGFEVSLFARHQGVHVASGSCESCERTSLELKRIALSVVPRRETGCFYQILDPGSESGARDGPGMGTDVCVVLRAVSRSLPLGVSQLSCLRSIEEGLRRLGGSRRT